MEAVAQIEDYPELFSGIFTDLVAIPSLRPQLLAILRVENRSDALARAIGKLFS